MSNSVSGDPYQTGNDAVFKIGGQEFAVGNVSYTKDVNTNEIQMNDSLSPRIAVTGLRFSGSFEHSGHNEKLRNAVEHSKGGEGHEVMEPKRGTLTLTEETNDGGSRTTTFEGVLVTSRSKEMPSDDSASVSYDFAAENMSVMSA